MPLRQYLTLMPLADWLAIGWFVALWVGYAVFARRRAERSGSLLATTNHYRRLWMLQTTARENRVVDGVVVQNLSTSPSFFASTTILIIGGLLALLGTSDKASEFVREIPFAARTSTFVFDLKLMVLLVIFIYAFFRFTWSMRQYTFGAPPCEHGVADPGGDEPGDGQPVGQRHQHQGLQQLHRPDPRSSTVAA